MRGHAMWRIKYLFNHTDKWLMDQSIVLIIWFKRYWVTSSRRTWAQQWQCSWPSNGEIKRWHNLKKEAQVWFNSTLGNHSMRRGVSYFLDYYIWLWCMRAPIVQVLIKGLFGRALLRLRLWLLQRSPAKRFLGEAVFLVKNRGARAVLEEPCQTPPKYP